MTYLQGRACRISRDSHPVTSRPGRWQACPAGSAPASALDNMPRCRPLCGRHGACHDGPLPEETDALLQRDRICHTTKNIHRTCPRATRQGANSIQMWLPGRDGPKQGTEQTLREAPPSPYAAIQHQRPLKTAYGKDGPPDAQQAPARLPEPISCQDHLPALSRIPETAEEDGKKQQYRQRKGVEHPVGQPAAAVSSRAS